MPYLLSKKAEFERKFGAEFEWRRMDEKKVSIIAYTHPFDGYARENWPAMIEWLVEHVRKIEKAFSGEIGNLRQLLKKQFPKDVA